MRSAPPTTTPPTYPEEPPHTGPSQVWLRSAYLPIPGLLASGRARRAWWPAPSTPGATNDVGQHKERDDDADYDRDDGNGGGGEQHGTILSRPRNH
jgi:hypothetical protein